jgi:hypothetical protein
VRFWTSESPTNSAEVDFVLPFGTVLLPVEVKSGKAGRLRSLHAFMDHVDHDLAVRLYRGPVRVDEIKSVSGRTFRLLNLPYYLASRVLEYVSWVGV